MSVVRASSELPDPKDLSHLFSRTTKARAFSNIKRFYKYFSIPGIGQLAGGLPHPDYFPYDTLEAKTALPNRFKPTPNRPIDPPSDDKKTTRERAQPASHTIVPKVSGAKDPLKKIDVTSALQYGQAQGYPALQSFILQMVKENIHPNIPYAGGADVVLTCGSTDGFSKALQCFNNEWSEGINPIEEREGLLCEKYAYMNAIQTARPRGMNIVPVEIDDEGMLATGKGGLQDVLENWDHTIGKRPHIMYTVTMGQNPTSAVLSVRRRKEIYALCSKYDIIIVEDDPYWYLQFPSATARNIASGRTQKPKEAYVREGKSSGFDFLDSLVPSYLSVDTDGRVVRLDTFSKTVAPGCRMGWITATPQITERILRITECSTQQPSGFVQALIAELIMGPQFKQDPGHGGAKDGSGWDVSGWVRWLEGLRGNYERRMNTMCDILEDGKFQVKTGRRASLSVRSESEDEDDWAVVERVQLYDFTWPVGGMFVWLKVAFESHPLMKSKKVPGQRLAQALWIFWTSKPYLVLVSPGTIFAPTPQIAEESAWQFFRICFAAADEDVLGPFTERWVEGINAFWRIKDEKVIDDLLKEMEGNSLDVQEMSGLGSLVGFC